jgi:EAL domain
VLAVPLITLATGATKALDFDPVAYLGSSRAAVDADLAELGEQEWLRPLRAPLKRVRSIVDTGLPLVNLLVQTAHILGLTVVAEGADSIAQLTRLRGIGCDLVQGYVISRPLPGPDAAAWAGGLPWPEPAAPDSLSTVD